jgi:hypothetical protein
MIAALLLCGTAPGLAQDTRAELIQQQQAENQRVITPPRRNVGEAIVNRLENWGLLGTPRGVYPWLGSVYPGAGLAGGAGVRLPFADDGAVSGLAAYSTTRSSRGQADVTLPTFAKRRGRVTLSGRYLDASDVAYYGVGMGSRKEDQTHFGYTPISGGARLDFSAGRHWTFGGGVTYLDIATDEGRTGLSPADLFTAAAAPGLELDSYGFVNSRAVVAFDWRRPLGYSGSGGLYRIQFDHYREMDEERYRFRSYEAEALQLFPILRANWVVALRGLATVTDTEDDGRVPFFLMPALGGNTTLRGYPSFRFRDANRLLMNAELRWTPARFLDMAVFYDTGKVASRRKDLNVEDLEDSYGMGVRVVGLKGYALVVEVARSREHAARVVVSAGGAF